MKVRRYILAIIMAAICTSAAAQYTNTLYFMDEISERNAMNPAFLPRCQSYFDFMLLPNFYVGGGETMFAIKDLTDINKLTQNILKGRDGREFGSFHINIVNFGVAVGLDQYFIFESGINFDESVTIPKDLFRLVLEGMPDPNQRYSYNLNSFNTEINAYTYAGIGYSGRLSKYVTFGVKAKALFGMANMKTNVYKMELQTSRDNWTLSSQASANVALCYPLEFSQKENGGVGIALGELPESKIPVVGSYIKAAKPAGYGAALDLGITVEPIKNLVISAAVTDLGMIHWYQNSLSKFSLNTNVTFDGIIDYSLKDTSGMGGNTQQKLNDLGDQIMDSIKVGTTDPYNAMLYAKFNAGIEYGILKNKISFGVMNRLTFNNKRFYDEVTLAINFRPCAYIKAALSYSFINGNWGTLGLGLNLNLGPVCMYLITDYAPITWARVYSEEKGINMPLPDRLKQFNLQAGMSFNLHRFDHDNDRDGVPNRYDACPDESIEYLRKKHPRFKLDQFTNKNGCIYDEDKDGITDFEDLCPNTPVGAQVDSVGCPVDSDNDSVPDYMDQCPETPSGVAVDLVGCPIDSDKDGVPDYMDKCPETPRNADVDSVGCPLDTDGDNVPDYLDKCPETPEGVRVDTYGCPIDSDKDGIADYIDKCPDTPGNVAVDFNGCPKDTDNDSVPDYLDKCPNVPGTMANDGCPEVKEEVRQIFRKAMTGIQFETAKAIIKKSSYPILNQIVAVMEMDTTYKLEISGHTDSQGDHDKNVRLSQERAQAVADYISSKGIDPRRMTAIGYGPDRPIADNSTKKGMAQNRRVEFEIVYETVTSNSDDGGLGSDDKD